jgi:hypothetical protein
MVNGPLTRMALADDSAGHADQDIASRRSMPVTRAPGE